MLSEDQVAERLGVSTRQLQRQRASGDGPPFTRISKRRLAYSEQLLDEWLRARTYPHRAAELVAGNGSPTVLRGHLTNETEA